MSATFSTSKIFTDNSTANGFTARAIEIVDTHISRLQFAKDVPGYKDREQYELNSLVTDGAVYFGVHNPRIHQDLVNFSICAVEISNRLGGKGTKHFLDASYTLTQEKKGAKIQNALYQAIELAIVKIFSANGITGNFGIIQTVAGSYITILRESTSPSDTNPAPELAQNFPALYKRRFHL